MEQPLVILLLFVVYISSAESYTEKIAAESAEGEVYF